MSASFHSPAPWTVNASGGARTIVARDRSVVAVVVGSNGAAPFEVGNGQLLAAAPDLYAALKACLGSFELAHCHKKLNTAADGGIVCACDLARAALAKSEGR